MHNIKRILSVFIVILCSFMFVSCEFFQKGTSVNESESGNLKVHFIDVGQADSILIQQGNENMLIDAGNNDDENILKNYLNNLGIKEFTYVVGTHAHEDHIGSLDYIIKSFKVGKIYFPETSATTKTFENVVTAVKDKGMQFTVPKVGETFNLGQAKCTILAPNSSNYKDGNDYSIVIKMEYGNKSFIFTGDAEELSENEILKKGFNLKADVLKVGHHGSKSSTSDKFLNAVNPEYAVISVGKVNDYGHPNEETLDKLNKKGIKVYRTDESGTIVATCDGKSITFNTNPSESTSSGTTTHGIMEEEAENESDINLNHDDIKSNSDVISTNTLKNKIPVWVSKNGGKVYHKDKNCSGMKKSVEYTQKDAEAKGLKPCSKCAQ